MFNIIGRFLDVDNYDIARNVIAYLLMDDYGNIKEVDAHTCNQMLFSKKLNAVFLSHKRFGTILATPDVKEELVPYFYNCNGQYKYIDIVKNNKPVSGAIVLCKKKTDKGVIYKLIVRGKIEFVPEYKLINATNEPLYNVFIRNGVVIPKRGFVINDVANRKVNLAIVDNRTTEDVFSQAEVLVVRKCGCLKSCANNDRLRVVLFDTIDSIVVQPETFSNCKNLVFIGTPLTFLYYATLSIDKTMSSNAISPLCQVKSKLCELSCFNELVDICKNYQTKPLYTVAFKEGACKNCNSLLYMDFSDFYEEGYTPKIIFENNAFVNCRQLCKLELNCSEIVFDKHCFEGCQSLKSVEVGVSRGQIAVLNTYCFAKCEKLCYVSIMPIGLNRIPNKDTSVKIRLGEYCFSECHSLEYVEFSKISVIESADAFNDCTKLTRISTSTSKQYYLTDLSVLPDNNDKCFKNCSSLKKIMIGVNLKHIYETNDPMYNYIRNTGVQTIYCDCMIASEFIYELTIDNEKGYYKELRDVHFFINKDNCEDYMFTERSLALLYMALNTFCKKAVNRLYKLHLDIDYRYFLQYNSDTDELTTISDELRDKIFKKLAKLNALGVEVTICNVDLEDNYKSFIKVSEFDGAFIDESYDLQEKMKMIKNGSYKISAFKPDELPW